ncbi:caspase family protein [Oscillatoria sp. CS-180]|uniref:caspase family protein n=1 Tax=Oscillatoria sp. CS-180 TaxID=3021720 RepID=UPI0023312E98|nr:caspase family protein [Oscillatoria sp. CS-180]MDB9526377.1 caspase family protein [Oscillatoria sp. CS-180]
MARGFSRRHFLQTAGATLAALGWSQRDVMLRGDRYGRALAQSTPRKLALLVGINEYPQDGLFAPLYGCVNDVEMQYQLLVHRFGFNPNDIVKLTDQQATRDAILTTFEEHLIKQAQPGDVVVFHFSGHGSRVVDPDQDFPDGLNSTLVPVDSPLPAGFPRSGGAVDDITGHTIFLLGSAIPTENFTMVLDSCHSGGAKRGNLIIRARPGGSDLTMSEVELAYQDDLRSRLNISPEEFIRRRREGIAKGVAIASARRNQYAADAPFEDFYAGAFTFVLTQYLWQQTGTTSFNSTLGNVARTTTQVSFSNQEPQFETQPGSSFDNVPIYFTQKATAPAEAVVTNIASGEVEVWLGGVDPHSLEVFGEGAVLSGVDNAGQSRGLVRLTQRQGLIGKGRLLEETTLPTGLLLQEQIRGVPTDVTLRIGLDESLGEDIEAARTALLAAPRVEPLALGDREVHYVLGRMTAAYRQELADQPGLPLENSIGLFSQGLDLVPDSYGNPGESIAAAVTRLQSKLRSLFAARMVKLTLNPGSSRLNLNVAMIPESGNEVYAQQFTVRGGENQSAPRPGVEVLPLGTALRFEITNQENRDLYLSVLVIDSSGVMSVIFPNQWVASTEATLLPAGETLQLPNPVTDSFRLVTQEPKGTTEVLIVASSNPLDNALRGLQAIADDTGISRGPLGISDPTDVVNGLLDDISATDSNTSPSVQPVSVTQLAALSITFDVV